MVKTKAKKGVSTQPLEAGQVWSVAGLNLQVTSVGPFLVNYKLAKPDAVRIPNMLDGKTTIEKYLKKNKAVLVKD